MHVRRLDIIGREFPEMPSHSVGRKINANMVYKVRKSIDLGGKGGKGRLLRAYVCPLVEERIYFRLHKTMRSL